ncbi:hypothetical protein HDU85_004427 [Gaertneriomyces sp. JEL0708]|nr:hypothetical protein HDU85_004427 [Gaertneriomyces sp. JEL0708]
MEACRSDPGTIEFFTAACKAQCTTEILKTIPVYVKITTEAYGGPSQLIGSAWVFVLASCTIGLWRVKERPTMRAYFLLVAALCSAINIANLSWGRSVSKFELNVSLHFHLAVIFGVAQMGCTLAAAAWRFGPVYMDARVRQAVTLGTACYAIGWTITLLIYGNVLVARSGRVGRVFWGLCATIPFAYCVFGLLTFARAIRQLHGQFKSFRSAHGQNQETTRMLKYLQVSNDIALCLTTLCSAIFIVVTQVWDSIENPWVLPAAMAGNTICTFAESSFEVLTVFQVAAGSTTASAKIQAPGSQPRSTMALATSSPRKPDISTVGTGTKDGV